MASIALKALLAFTTLFLILQTSTAKITGLVLVDAGTDKDIGPLNDGDTLVIPDLPSTISVRAEVDDGPDTQMVEFTENGKKIQTEKSPPYAIEGDKNGGGDYYPWKYPLGAVSLSVKQTLKSGGSNTFEIAFTISATAASAGPSPAASVVPSPGASVVPSPGASVVPSPGASVVPSPGASVVPSPGASVVPSPDASIVPSPDASIVPSPGASIVPSPGASIVPSPGASIVPSPGASIVPSPGASIVPSPAGSAGASPPPPTGSTFKLNVGSGAAVGDFIGDDGATYITGTTSTSSGAGAGILASHRWASTFGLSIPLDDGDYDVILYFFENYLPACATGVRKIDVTVGDKPTLTSLDVFAKAGCTTEHKEIFKEVTVTGNLVVTLKGVAQNAYLSGIEVVPAGTAPDPSPGGPDPSVTPVAVPSPVVGSTLSVNFGSTATVGDFVGDDGSYLVGTTKTSSAAGTGIYASHRWGMGFNLEVPLADGSYDVTLHFAENYPPNCAVGARKFDVTVGDKDPVLAVDVFDEVGCTTPYTLLSEDVAVTGKLVIVFKAVVQNAFVSGISIASAGSGTGNPIPTIVIPSPTALPSPIAGDNGAHAVPPVFDDPIVDLNKDGKQTIALDGSGSHTHFFDTTTSTFASLNDWVWKNKDTEEVLCSGPNEQFCVVTFELGSTMVELCVKDTAGTSNCAETTVTVVESISPGIYCYYYDFTGASGTTVPLEAGLEAAAGASPKPLFGAADTAVSFPTINSFPDFLFKTSKWAQRCTFFFDTPVTEYFKFTVKHTGGVALYVGEESVISADASATSTTSEGTIMIPEGLQSIDLIYYKTSDTAQLELSYNATAVSFKYDKAIVLPIISAITPTESDLNGANVKVTGLNIDSETDVLFGTKKGTAPVYTEPTQVQLNAPPVSEAAEVSVVLSNSAGTSNSKTFNYGGEAPAAIKFTQTTWQGLNPVGVANIALGPDFKYYMATVQGKVIVADVDHYDNYEVKSSCTTATLSDPKWKSTKGGGDASRWILGIAFNPKDTAVKAYIATSSLFWGPGEGNYLNDDFAWANGNIEVLEPGEGCLTRTSFLVTGLPVSNHDHSVNGLVFDNDGDLHFQVGGFTNQGIPGSKLGGLDENPLSAASIVAKTSLGASFNGEITYDNKIPELAKQLTGDVEVFASGLRNSYGLVLHSNGKYYATDNGPNNSFGKRSTDCDGGELDDKGHGDKILQLKPDKYYGSPNRNRGKAGNAGECIFIDDNGKLPNGATPPGSYNFDLPLAKVQSSTNGIIEYTANTFSGQLRGNLFAAKFAGGGTGKVWRVGLKADGTKDFGPDQFFTFDAGLSIIQGLDGSIHMPQVQKNKVVVLKPDYPTPTSLTIIAVTPFRGAKGGGTKVIISGQNFGTAPTATFGDEPCTAVTEVKATSFMCTTPPGTGLVNVAVSSGANSASVVGGFWYMNI